MSGRPVLQVRGLHKQYGRLHAVDGLDLDLHAGEVLGFLGPNGAGKTTSLRMMCGLLRPTAGRIGIGPNHAPPSNADARRHIGVCPQDNVVYPELTVRENLEYAAAIYGVPRDRRRKRAERLLDELGLRDKEKAQAETLSGGLRRRLTIGMALAHDPQIVFLDEPEAGLDPQSRVAVRDFIKSLARRRTVVLTSHNMDEVERVVDRVIIMDHGRVIAHGTPEALKQQHGAGDRVTFRLAQPDAASVASRLVHQFAGVTHEGPSLTVHGRGLVPRIPDLVDAVRAAGGTIADMHYQANTLEEVFIALTGRGLRE